MIVPTRLERKLAAKQALALLTASVHSNLDDELITDLIHGLEDLPLVLASVVGLASGLLKSFDDQAAGAADMWLANVGRNIEALSEDG